MSVSLYGALAPSHNPCRNKHTKIISLYALTNADTFDELKCCVVSVPWKYHSNDDMSWMNVAMPTIVKVIKHKWGPFEHVL